MNAIKGNKIVQVTLISAVLLCLTFVILGAPAFCEDYPSRPIVLIVGSSPGGGYDTQGRLFSKFWPDYLPKKVTAIVKNVTGGGGFVAANRVWISRPDGYTIMQMKMGAFILGPMMYPSQVKFDIARWEYIGQYTADTNALATRVEIAEKIRSYDDLVKLSQKEPIACSTGGVGGTAHNKELIFAEASGIRMRFIHYAGTSESIAALMRRESDFTLLSAPSVARQDPKEIRALFVFSDKTNKQLPEAPTALEFGLPPNVLKRVRNNPIFSTPRALALPPDTPANVLKILRDSFWKMVNSKECIRGFEKAGQLLDPLSGQELTAQLPELTDEVKKFVPILKKQIK